MSRSPTVISIPQNFCEICLKLQKKNCFGVFIAYFEMFEIIIFI